MSISYSVIENDFLKENYPTKGPEYCSKVIKRSKSSIYCQACRLNLKYHQEKINLVKLNTEKGAYMLGFLWADGNIKKHGFTVRCSILYEDGIEIKDVFGSIGEWTVGSFEKSNRKKMMHFEVWDKHFYDLLQRNDYGLKSSRSPSKILAFIDKKYHHYFWRGYFDGDGCFYKITAGVSGSIEQDWSDFITLLNTLHIGFRLLKYNLKTGKSSRVVIVNYTNLLKLGNYLYRGENFGFSRKRDRFLFIIEKAQSRFSNIKGYWFDKRRKRYVAAGWIKKKQEHLGSFLTKEEALEARKAFLFKNNSNEHVINMLIQESISIVSPGASRHEAKIEPAIINMV